MKHLIAAGLVLAALLLTACGRDQKAIEVPPPVEAAPAVIDVPVAAPVVPAEVPAVVAPAPKPKSHSKPHRRAAPRPMVIKPRVVQQAPEPQETPFEEFCLIGLCVAPPYRMEN